MILGAWPQRDATPVAQLLRCQCHGHLRDAVDGQRVERRGLADGRLARPFVDAKGLCLVSICVRLHPAYADRCIVCVHLFFWSPRRGPRARRAGRFAQRGSGGPRVSVEAALAAPERLLRTRGRITRWIVGKGAFSTSSPEVVVEVRVQDADLGDRPDGRLVASRRTATRLGSRPLVKPRRGRCYHIQRPSASGQLPGCLSQETRVFQSAKLPTGFFSHAQTCIS